MGAQAHQRGTAALQKQISAQERKIAEVCVCVCGVCEECCLVLQHVAPPPRSRGDTPS